MDLARQKSDRRFAIGITALYAAWVLFVAVHHEPWRDEADVWLAARDMTPLQLFHWLGSAGTPGLWYLLLMPLAKLGLPYISMTLLHATIAIVVAALIAFCSPFSRLLKTLILFSYPLAYEYSVVARSYVLTCLWLFLIAMQLRAEKRRYLVLGPCLLLLFNTNAHGFFFAGAISLVIGIDVLRKRQITRQVIAGGVIAAVGGMIAFLQLLPPPNAHNPTLGRRWPVAGYALCEGFLPHIEHYASVDLANHSLRIDAVYYGTRTLGAAIVLSTLYLARRRRDVVAIVILGWLALMYIGIFKWYGGERHAGLILILILFALWITTEPKTVAVRKKLEAAFVLNRVLFLGSLLVSCGVAIAWSWWDFRWDYSGSTEAASYLRSQMLDGSLIAAASDPCKTVLPYIPGARLWYATDQAYGTYTHWDGHWQDKLAETDILTRTAKQFPSGPYLLIIPDRPLSTPEQSGYRLLFKNTHYIFEHNEETYYIYRHDDGRSP